MKSLNTIQKLSKIGKVLSKIAFIFSVIGFCGCIAGLLSLNFGNGRLIKIGGVTLHGLIPEEYGYNIKSITATLSGWLIVCAGEAVLAKFAESYFKNELKAKTPFTLAGAKKLLQLGILTITIPTACAVAGSIAEGIIAGFMKVKQTEAMDMYFDNESSIVLGIMYHSWLSAVPLWSRNAGTFWGDQAMKLETERLFLQEMTSDDFDALYAVLADSDIMQHYPYAFDEARVRNWINKNRERYRVFGFGLWAVWELSRTIFMTGKT